MTFFIGKLNVLFFLCLSVLTVAQSNEFGPDIDTDRADSYSFEFILLQDGNSTGYINSVVETDEGMLWMAGDNGLFLHDGKELRIFNNTSQSSFLDVDLLVNIKKLNDDYLILVGHDELYWFNIHTKTIDHKVGYPIHVIPAVMKTAQIANITITDDETIWLLSPLLRDSMYLAKIDKDGIASYVDKFKTSYFTKLISEGHSVIVGRDEGVNIYNSKTDIVKRYDIVVKDKLFVPYSIVKDREGTIWLKGDCEFESSFQSSSNAWVENDCSIYYLKDGDDAFKRYEELSQSELTGTFFLNKDGSDFWIGGDHLQLKTYNIESKKIIDYTPQLLSSFKRLKRSPFFSQIINYHRDSGGSVWISTSAGLIKGTIDPQSLYQIHLRSDARFCQSICVMHGVTEDEDGSIYVAYNNDVAKINANDESVEYIDKLEFASDIATSYGLIYQDGLLYWNDLVYDLSNGTSTYLTDTPGSDEIANYLDSQGQLWIETKSNDSLQVILYDTQEKQSKVLKIEEGFASAIHINQFIESKVDNHIWIGTLNGGIYEINRKGEVLNHYDTSRNSAFILQEQYAGCLYEDEDQNMWIGSKSGLAMINRERTKIEYYAERFKLFRGSVVNREIYSILPGGDDHLLLGTNKGLSKFEKETGQFESLNGLDVLQDEEYNRLSAFQAKNGKYYFGSVNGLFSFYLDDIDPYFSSGTKHDLTISNISVFNNSSNKTRSLDPKGKSGALKLKYDDQNIVINYVLPDNKMAPEILYSYKMSGLSDMWSLPSHNNTITFDYLPAGEYDLEIRAGYELNNLNYSSLSQKIIIPVAWYKSWWFIALCLLGVISSIYTLVTLRIKQLAEKQLALTELRTKISSDLHDDVGTILSGLSMQAQVLGHHAFGEQKEQLSQISDMSIEAMDRMRDTVWAIDSRQDKYVNLIDRIRDFAEQNLHNSEIDFTFDSSGINQRDLILPNIRQQLYLIFKEALNNSIKHANADMINITLEKDNDLLKLSIRDNGKGSKKVSKSGLGMRNMKMRAKKIGGELRIEQISGFKVEVLVKV